ncbi:MULTISPECIES: cupredoxin domain-containing protein [unclassified Paenibacillus]|uniref:cupredoxin domain-containing protein n=1 Tax=unclassified Paenibacillus TaxID=185978 RepID=UPI003630E84A
MTKVVIISKKQIRNWAIITFMAVGAIGAAWYWGHSGGGSNYSETSKPTSKVNEAKVNETTKAVSGMNGTVKQAGLSVNESGQGRTINIVTGEFKTTGADGKPIEAYRWDPGTIHVKQGELINLSIFGVNGTNHPFIIDGLSIKGEVKKGKETVVSFKADKPGTYRIICLTHPDIAHNGPMVGYIVVDA